MFVVGNVAWQYSTPEGSDSSLAKCPPLLSQVKKMIHMRRSLTVAKYVTKLCKTESITSSSKSEEEENSFSMLVRDSSMRFVISCFLSSFSVMHDPTL